MTRALPSPQEFMRQSPYPARRSRDAAPSTGSDSWAVAYGQVLKDVAVRYAERLPRNVQRHLGPSELGHQCDRLLIGKMAGPAVHHVNQLADPWASMVGTAIHAFLEKAFDWDNKASAASRNGHARWQTEYRVTPDPHARQPHPGTADLYDYETRTLCDHKALGDSSRAKLRSHGPPQHYYIQMLLYAIGYMQLGYPVMRIVLAAWPRTKSSLDEMYTWAHVITEADFALVADVLRKTEIREQLALEVAAGRMSVWQVPPTPDPEECFYCPLHRPQSAIDGGYGCPGPLARRP